MQCNPWLRARTRMVRTRKRITCRGFAWLQPRPPESGHGIGKAVLSHVPTSALLSLWLALAWITILAAPAECQAELPENLAAKARVSASSEYSDQYLARFAVDGRIPPAGSQAADRGTAWCVRKEQSGDQGELRFEWDKPVEVAELVYFGRTAWYMTECWKDFEVYVDEAEQPVVRGTFRMIHGPQRVALPRQQVRRLTIRFLNSYGGPNPGAAEMALFAQSPHDEDLAAWERAATLKVAAARPAQGEQATPPRVDAVDRDRLRALIERLHELHAAGYPQAAEHLARLDKLANDAPELVELQREVLLFDVDRLLVIKRHEINASHVYTYHYEGQRDGGGLYVFSAHEPDQAPVELVASPDGQILDCELSWDGRKVLFSWRRGPGEGYHLWTVDIDGENLKQLTDGPWHDYNGCWLPDGHIAFLSTRRPQFAYCWHAPVGVLHRMNADGTGVRCLSANYLNDFTPAVLDDGRIIYSRWEYVDRPAIPIQSLWTLNPDGTGLSVYFGNRVLSPGTFMEARSVPGTELIICTMTGHNGPTRGAIGLIDRRRGLNAQEAITNLTPDTPVPRVDQGTGNTSGSKLYSSPVPLDSARFLMSARGPVLVRDLAGDCCATVLPAPADGMQHFAAQPVRARRRPPVIPSMLPDEPEGNDAVVYLQDVYNGLEPYVERGEVKTLRVVRELHKPLRIDPALRAFGFQFPVISCGATYAGKEVLGEVPVEPDGSACFRVPAGVPVYFMVLDAEGRALQRMRSFTHFMPGEVQGCIGCHEHRLHGSPVRLASGYLREPEQLAPPAWGTGGFDYARIVQPVLDRYCADCHTPPEPEGRVDLSGDKTDFFNVSYDVLAREHQGPAGTRFVNWIPTYNGQEQNILEVRPKAWGSPRSLLAELVRSGHRDAEGNARVQMDAASRRRVFAWIDLNVPYYGTSETAYPEMPGCRQLVPSELERVLGEVAQRRCAECHDGGNIPRREWLRITRPELNPFLLAPLSREAGGTQRCARAVFQDIRDPDYQAILATFEPISRMLAERPRMDMPGAQPSCEVSRSCQ